MKVIIDIAEPYDEGMFLIAVSTANEMGGVSMADRVYNLQQEGDLMALGIGADSTDPSSPKELRELAKSLMKMAADTEGFNRVLQQEVQ